MELNAIPHIGILSIAMLLPPVVLAAQSTATFTATITESETGAPLEGVSVAVAGSGYEKLSDARGHVRLTGIEPVYAGPAETPGRFQMLAPCGAVVIWTRR